MTVYDDWIRNAADFYGVSVAEAKARAAKVSAQKDDPQDPICVGCALRPHELDCYLTCGDVTDTTEAGLRRYVIQNEGTYNRENGHFLCDECYIKNGMPSSPRGWVAP